jgi:ribonucleoside-diphosphate reductase alpha chain
LLEYTRRRKVPSGSKNIVFTDSSGDNWEENIVYHKHFKTWKDINNKENVEDSPYYNATANDIDWNTSVKLQSVAQKWITHSISKTCNIPNNSTKDLVNEIYLTAYDSRCKGFTVYRDGCRDGVLISNENNSSGSIKRPKEVPCDVHHVSVKGQPYFILLGIVNGNIYEIFAGKNGVLDHKIKSGKIVKMKRPRQYKFIGEDESELTPISAFSDNEQQAITRLISIALQAGTPIDKIITQLDKTDGDLTSFSKAVIKSLKKYIQDGTNSINICPECKSGLIYSENCLKCQNCGWSRC